MPVEFLTEAQIQRYGHFTGKPTPEQLAQDSGAHNRLGVALQLGTVRFLGAFLPNPIDIRVLMMIGV